MDDIKLDLKDFVIESPPGDTLRDVLSSRGITQAELALRMGRPVKTISNIIQGKTSITPSTALQLERVLGISAIFWVNRENQYRESQQRQEEKKNLQSYLTWLDKFPIQKMVDYGWLKAFDDSVRQVYELLSYFGVVTPKQWNLYWESTLPNLKDKNSYINAPEETTAWLRRGEIIAQSITCQPFQSKKLKDLFEYINLMTCQQVQEFYSDLVNMLARSGVAFCVVPDLPSLDICLVTRWLTPTKALVQINANYTHSINFWQAVFHSLGHLLLHGKRDAFLDECDQVFDDQEEEADQFMYEFFRARTEAQSDSIELDWETIFQNNMDNDISPKRSENIEFQAACVSKEPSMKSLKRLNWPGLSVAAYQVLKIAGMEDEASETDEKLFAVWLEKQLNKFDSALQHRYYHDAIHIIDKVVDILKINANRNPVLDVMIKMLELIKLSVADAASTTKTEEIEVAVRKAIEETLHNEGAVAEIRKEYSLASTQSESGLAEQLFKN